MFPPPDTFAWAPPSLQWVPWPPLAGALRFPTFPGTMGWYDCSPSIRGRLWFPLATGTSLARGDGEVSWVPGESLGSMPRASDSGDPGTTLALTGARILPSARLTASTSQRETFSELNLHGLLPCCVRFAPTSHPVNGNTRYRPVG
jgi:hypothetical protein